VDEVDLALRADAQGGYTFEHGVQVTGDSDLGNAKFEDSGVLRDLQTGREIACVEQAAGAPALDDRYIYWSILPAEPESKCVYPDVPAFAPGLYRIPRTQ
jgi:hypothetical protein